MASCCYRAVPPLLALALLHAPVQIHGWSSQSRTIARTPPPRAARSAPWHGHDDRGPRRHASAIDATDEGEGDSTGAQPSPSAAPGIEIPEPILEDGHMRGIEIWGCYGEEECEKLGFDERAVAVLWRDVTDFSSGLESPEQKFRRGIAARNMVHETKGRVIAVDENDNHVVASV